MGSEGDDFDLDRNDFLEIIRELKRQIFQVFQEAGTCNFLLNVPKSGQRFHCIATYYFLLAKRYNDVQRQQLVVMVILLTMKIICFSFD